MRRHIPKQIKKKQTPKTREILFYHTKKRLRQRYDFICDLNRYNLFSNMISASDGKSNDCRFLQRQSTNATVWEVTYKGQCFIFVYDKTRHAIVTALPPGTTDLNYER